MCSPFRVQNLSSQIQIISNVSTDKCPTQLSVKVPLPRSTAWHQKTLGSQCLLKYYTEPVPISCSE